jgi:hypothetical protein
MLRAGRSKSMHRQNIEVKNTDGEKLRWTNVKRKNAEWGITSNGVTPTRAKGRIEKMSMGTKH